MGGMGMHSLENLSIADRRTDPRESAQSSFVGESPEIEAIKEIAVAVAPRQSSVLILGETGTGKEALARFVHQQSNRSDRPFVPVDCSALPDNLFESQMFGHVKGAFTGAMRDAMGFVRAANGGTLFLDEIGELTLPMQAKFLRVLQDRRVTPVGSHQSERVDVRVVAATNRDLQQMVHEGTFRQDLFFRLNVIVLTMPPLRRRISDILPLARHFLNLQAELYDETPRNLSPQAREAMMRYGWPGNVRELANIMEHAHVLARSHDVQLTDLPPKFQAVMAPAGVDAGDGSLRLEDIEREAIAEALKRAKFNKAAAARMLGLNIQRLNRRITRLGITIP
jgi:transcriptional regulator with PAS, ATPase and Fis domain